MTNGGLKEHPTSNTQRPIGASRRRATRSLHWMLGVGCFSGDKPEVLSTRKKLVRPLREELQPRGITAADFENPPALVFDLVQCLHCRGPVVVAFSQLDAEAFAQTFLVPLLAAELLDVQIDD